MHPEWKRPVVITVPGRGPVRSRNQLVLDFSRAEVRQAVFAQMLHYSDQSVLCGREYAADEVVTEIQKDVLFYLISA